MKRRPPPAAPLTELPPPWMTHFELGLRHVGSVTEDGHVHLGGLDRLHALEVAWCRERGLERLP